MQEYMLPHMNTHHLHLLLCKLFINCISLPVYIKLSTLFAGTPVRTKKQIVEKYLEGKRLREEKVMLEKEDDWIFTVLQTHYHTRNHVKNRQFDSVFKR